MTAQLDWYPIAPGAHVQLRATPELGATLDGPLNSPGSPDRGV